MYSGESSQVLAPRTTSPLQTLGEGLGGTLGVVVQEEQKAYLESQAANAHTEVFKVEEEINQRIQNGEILDEQGMVDAFEQRLDERLGELDLSDRVWQRVQPIVQRQKTYSGLQLTRALVSKRADREIVSLNSSIDALKLKAIDAPTDEAAKWQIDQAFDVLAGVDGIYVSDAQRAAMEQNLLDQVWTSRLDARLQNPGIDWDQMDQWVEGLAVPTNTRMALRQAVETRGKEIKRSQVDERVEQTRDAFITAGLEDATVLYQALRKDLDANAYLYDPEEFQRRYGEQALQGLWAEKFIQDALTGDAEAVRKQIDQYPGDPVAMRKADSMIEDAIQRRYNLEEARQIKQQQDQWKRTAQGYISELTEISRVLRDPNSNDDSLSQAINQSEIAMGRLQTLIASDPDNAYSAFGLYNQFDNVTRQWREQQALLIGARRKIGSATLEQREADAVWVHDYLPQMAAEAANPHPNPPPGMGEGKGSQGNQVQILSRTLSQFVDQTGQVPSNLKDAAENAAGSNDSHQIKVWADIYDDVARGPGGGTFVNALSGKTRAILSRSRGRSEEDVKQIAKDINGIDEEQRQINGKAFDRMADEDVLYDEFETVMENPDKLTSLFNLDPSLFAQAEGGDIDLTSVQYAFQEYLTKIDEQKEWGDRPEEVKRIAMAQVAKSWGWFNDGSQRMLMRNAPSTYNLPLAFTQKNLEQLLNAHGFSAYSLHTVETPIQSQALGAPPTSLKLKPDAVPGRVRLTLASNPAGSALPEWHVWITTNKDGYEYEEALVDQYGDKIIWGGDDVANDLTKWQYTLDVRRGDSAYLELEDARRQAERTRHERAGLRRGSMMGGSIPDLPG